MVRATGEAIRAPHPTPRLMMEYNIEPGEVERPPALPRVEMWGLPEVLQILVVGPDLYRVLCSLKEMPPLLERSDNGEHLLVVDFVVPLGVIEAFGEKGHWVPLLVGAQLREHGAGCEVRACCFQAIRPSRVREYQHWLGGHLVLQRLEGGDFGFPPNPPDILLREVEERPRDVGEPTDESPVEVDEAQELLYILPVHRCRPGSDPGDLHRVHPDGVVRDDNPEVLNRRLLKLAFLRPEVELVLPQAPENLRDDSAVRTDVRVGNEDVIQVDHDISGKNEVLENVVHHGLEGRRGIGEPEVHHQWLEKPPVGPERRFPFVALPDPDIVKPPPDIELRKEPGSL